jgi:hypothetical protein
LDADAIMLFVISLIFGFVNFYLDLKGTDFLRLLSYALSKILKDNRYFIFLMGFFTLFGAHVFFVTNFYSQHDIYVESNRGYHYYLYWTYEYIFGNYDIGSPLNPKFEPYMWFHWAFSFFY